MDDFESARGDLGAARAQAQTARSALDEARGTLARARERYAAALRTRKRGDALAQMAEAVRAAENALSAQRERVMTANAAAAVRADAYAKAADPRLRIEAWADDTPLLLLPVRLETRFRTLTDAAGAREELWVRIYPDTCAVDTFEPKLSANELASARRFWIDTWAAGGIEADRRSAWRSLVASHGSGRAAWIVREHAPADAAPGKAAASDLVLVIEAPTPPDAIERAALAAYWTEIWRAQGDRARGEAAMRALAGTAGVSDARALVATYVPVNLDAQPRPPATHATTVVQIAWLRLPAVTDAKTRSWSAPARVHVLPDHFVIVGYQDGALAFEAQGRPITAPLVAGPDPSAPPEEQLAPDAAGDLHVPDEMRWMVDFDAAVAAGMGVRIPLDPAKVDLTRPIERVLAIGLRLAEDREQGAATLETLLTHHRYGRAGLAVVPQGTPTNNTDDPAGYDRQDDADTAFDALFTDRHALPAEAGDVTSRRDGDRLADALGIDRRILDRVAHAAGTDGVEARALNRALWPATFGYAMQTMLHPVFGAPAVDATRWFQTQFVTGRGMLSALRIGDQPYGILPISAISQWKWLAGDRLADVAGVATPPDFVRYRVGLATLLGAMRSDWATLAEAVAHVGKPGDPHQVLLDVVGLHPASVEFHQRYAESLDHLFNRAKLKGLAARLLEAIRRNRSQAEARALLARLGYTGALEPDALARFFFAPANRLNGPLIDDRPLSERERIRAYTPDGRNYLRWLTDAARGSFEDLRQERGFADGRAPQALLYVMLRHALLLGYWDASLRLHDAADVLDAGALARARREPSFIHVQTDGETSESRYAPLYSRDARVAGDDGIVAERIRKRGGPSAQWLADQIAALQALEDVPTARLERAFAEHVDIASFRLDAWLLGLVNYQLTALRYAHRPAIAAGPSVAPSARSATVATRGIYLGAYGWLENLARKSAPLVPTVLDPELALIFAATDASAPLESDPSNGGHLLAPSITHASTAAILRAGYLANASAANPGALAVNLSSRRVRVALGLLEGIRSGQPLGALLGYRFQRGLHDGHPGLELDRFVYPLRKAFPLVADRMASTRTPEAVPIETIEANNVLDGLKLVERVSRPAQRNYPFGLDLPTATAAERAAIDAEVDALLDAHDALADLALAEGVHQAVLGNYDRVAATLDAYAKGGFPTEPEVVRTPRSGLGLTHRVALHFAAGVDPDVSPIAGMAMTPRASAQAMVNAWLAAVLPAPDRVGARVEWFDPIANAPRSATVTQAELKLQPIDLLHVVTPDREGAASELDDRILRRVIEVHGPRPDAPLTIRHTVRLPAPMISFFELAPLVRHLATILLGSRPLAPTDMVASGEAERALDGQVRITRARIEKVVTPLAALGQDLANAAIAAPVDAAIRDAAALFERAARFGMEQAGWGQLYAWRRGVFADLIARIQARIDGWTDRIDRFAAALARYDALPAATPEAERFSLLGQLDLLTSAAALTPRPATPAGYRAAVLARRGALEAKRTALRALSATAQTQVAPLLAAVQALGPLDAFDLDPLGVADVSTAADRFVAELNARIATLRKEVARRLAAARAQLDLHDASAVATVRVAALQAAGQALLGESITLIPEFELPAEQSTEVANALAAGADPAFTAYASSRSASVFPVDDWLHGVARVREKVLAWEQANALAPALGGAECTLAPMQLPHHPGEPWLALEIEPTVKIEGERLLYTAHYAAGATAGASRCGLLLDEWTEVVPARDETAAMSFHFDRPASEPPQAWLLVTPASMQGRWQWRDVVGALDEALALARLRAVEPAQVDTTAYARFLPATTSAVTLYGISIAANYARSNDVHARMPGGADG